MRHPKPVKKLLIGGNSRPLQRLAQFSNQLQELSALVQSCLPSPLQGQCQAVNIRKKTLILQTNSASWASQLRFYVPAMLSTLTHHQCHYLKEIHIQIKPVSAPQPSDTRRKFKISPRSATLITTLADSTRHPQLKDSLQKLAGRSKSEN